MMEESIIKTALTNGGISAILFIIWFFTVKYFSKQHDDTIKIHQEQFNQTLEQNSQQFSKTLLLNQEQHKIALQQNQNTLDKMFTLLQEDVKYKALLAETLTKLENKIDTQIKDYCG
ncbi:MAG: hypothetical protein V1773_01015 [bacterium]